MTRCQVLMLSLMGIFLQQPVSAQVASRNKHMNQEAIQEIQEKQFVALKEKFKTASKSWREKYAIVRENEPQKVAMLFKSHPYNSMAKEFLDLEAKTRGTKIGFSCLYHLVIQAGSVADSTWEVTKGKQFALKILGEHYRNYPDIDTTFRYLFSGASVPETKAFLRQLVAHSDLDYVKANAMFALANNLASEANYPAQIASSKSILDPKSDHDKLLLKNFEKLEADIRHLDVEKYRQESRELIQELRKEYSAILEPPRAETRTPAVIKVVRSKIDPILKTRRIPLLEKLPSVEFELNFGIGLEHPEINQNDAFGKPMRLSDFRGKVVVLMFSFKGCGPCERMYPGNRQLIKDLEDAPFVFLGVMGDEKIDTVIESVEKKTITWRVWWDGKEKSISQAWNIQGWPETYVIDKEGIIRYRGLRGQELSKAVRKLLR